MEELTMDNIKQMMISLLQPINLKLTSIEGRITNLEGRMTSIEGRMTSMEGRMTNLEGRMTSMESSMMLNYLRKSKPYTFVVMEHGDLSQTYLGSAILIWYGERLFILCPYHLTVDLDENKNINLINDQVTSPIIVYKPNIFIDKDSDVMLLTIPIKYKDTLEQLILSKQCFKFNPELRNKVLLFSDEHEVSVTTGEILGFAKNKERILTSLSIDDGMSGYLVESSEGFVGISLKSLVTGNESQTTFKNVCGVVLSPEKMFDIMDKAFDNLIPSPFNILISNGK